MSDYDPTELIAICQSILEDSEISSDELYSLAEWLNNHHDACFSWPGDVLVKLLQEIWCDGKVTKTELRRAAQRLLRIQKQWLQWEADAAFETAAESAERWVATMDLANPRLPELPCVTRLRSETEPGTFYEIELIGPSCTCADWHSRRRRLPLGHLTRCCKHLLAAYAEAAPSVGWPSWLGAFLDLSPPPHPDQDWFIVQTSICPVLASTAPGGWSNIYFEKGSMYETFGFNVIEQRWAYCLEPPCAEDISAAILKHIYPSRT